MAESLQFLFAWIVWCSVVSVLLVRAID